MYERELEVALDAARRAGAELLREYEHFQAIPNAPADITTEADRRSQEIILTHIHAAFPQDALCAEEATATLATTKRTGNRLWIVDPIDGTRGFARKNGEFSIMIAFVETDEIGVGVVAQPAAQRLTYATRSGGCWRRDGADAVPTRCHVSKIAELRQCTLTQSRSSGAKACRWSDAMEPARIVESYSAGIKLALIARAEADIYLNTYHEFHDWDICAGHLLVTEAGGQVTGLRGQTLHYGREGAKQRDGLLATNGQLHAPALRVVGA